MVRLFGLSLILGMLLALPASACRLALVLALDVSASVDGDEDRLQRNGLADALLAEDVQDAFFVSPDPVALAVFDWSGPSAQTQILPWVLIEEPNHLHQVSDIIRQSRRITRADMTALGLALRYGINLLAERPECFAHTIDVSGDGKNNSGFSPRMIYNSMPFDGITVNGLVINVEGADRKEGLIDYFEQRVIRGPASFVEEAKGFEDYGNAMRRKLIRELSSFAIGGLETAMHPPG